MKDMQHSDMNDYPHSVLDGVSVSVLTLMEKYGLSTCAELSTGLDMEEMGVSIIVNKLEENQLVQFYNGLLRPAEKGKHEIDLLEKSDQIIANAFSFDEMPPAEGELIRHILKLYREQDYTNYLFTMNSIKVWKRLCAEKNMVLDCNSTLLKEFLITLFIFDLKKAAQPKDRLSEKPLWFSLLYYNSPQPETSFITKAAAHITSFNALMSTKDFEKFTTPMKDFYEFLHYKEHFFADEIQSRFIDAVRMRKNININHTYLYFFNSWKSKYLGDNEGDTLREMDASPLQKGRGDKKNVIIDAERMVAKLTTSLKQDELALMVRLYIDAGIITNTSPKEVLEFITTFLTTKDQLSRPGFKIKYDKIGPATIARCRHWFKKLLEVLENHKGKNDDEN